VPENGARRGVEGALRVKRPSLCVVGLCRGKGIARRNTWALMR
jgi:hypothetical protein